MYGIVYIVHTAYGPYISYMESVDGRIVHLLDVRGVRGRLGRRRLQREFFIGNLLVRIHLIIVMIRWTGHGICYMLYVICYMLYVICYMLYAICECGCCDCDCDCFVLCVCELYNTYRDITRMIECRY